jgi:WD40 repeat protein
MTRLSSLRIQCLALGVGLLMVPGARASDEPLVLKGHTGWVGSVAFSRDGKTLATASGDKTVRLWDVATSKETAVLTGHTDCVTCIAYSPGGRTLASGSFDGTVRIWDVKRARELRAIKAGKEAVLAVVFHPEDSLMALGGFRGTIHWCGSDGRILRGTESHKTWVNGLAFALNGNLASASSDGTVKIWDALAGRELLELIGGAGEVRQIAFSPDGNMVAAGNRYGTARVFRSDDGKELITLRGLGGDVWSVAFSPDGKTLAATSGDWLKPGQVKLYDTTTWRERAALKHTGEILGVAFAPDGKRLAAGSWDKRVRIWRLRK